jgi:hypothetical protein
MSSGAESAATDAAVSVLRRHHHDFEHAPDEPAGTVRDRRAAQRVTHVGQDVDHPRESGEHRRPGGDPGHHDVPDRPGGRSVRPVMLHLRASVSTPQ